MHCCGIVIKHKDITVEEGREWLGKLLCRVEEADWYSTNNYRERLFSGDRQVIPLTEFRLLLEEWLDDNDIQTYPLAVISDNGEGKYSIVPPTFMEFYDYPDIRETLKTTFHKGYKSVVLDYIDELISSFGEAYEVTLLDYHC